MFFNLFKKTKKKETPQEVQYAFNDLLTSLDKNVAFLQQDSLEKIKKLDEYLKELNLQIDLDIEENLTLENLNYVLPKEIEKMEWKELEAIFASIITKLDNIVQNILVVLSEMKAMEIRMKNDYFKEKQEALGCHRKAKLFKQKIVSKQISEEEGARLIQNMEEYALENEKTANMINKHHEEIVIRVKFVQELLRKFQKQILELKIKQTVLTYEHKINQLTIKHFQTFLDQTDPLTKDAFTELEKRIEVEKQEIERLKAEILKKMDSTNEKGI